MHQVGRQEVRIPVRHVLVPAVTDGMSGLVDHGILFLSRRISSTAQSYSPNMNGFDRGRCRVVTVL
jgi:hypothetical protein